MTSKMRIIFLALLPVGLLASCGCTVHSATDDELMTFASLAMFPSIFRPGLVAFYKVHGRWPYDLAEMSGADSIPTDPRVQSYIERCKFSVKPDGSLEIEFPGEFRKGESTRINLPIPAEEPPP